MVFKIDEFTETMKYGGARPHLFQVQITLPVYLNPVATGGNFYNDFLVKATATSVPASVVSAIPVYYQGRAVNFSGNRSYAEWMVEVINDEDFNIYDAFIRWLAALNEPVDNVRGFGITSEPATYKSTATILQYGQDQALIKSWQCKGIFPTGVSEISLGWQNTNQIETFRVSFALDTVVPLPTLRSPIA